MSLRSLLVLAFVAAALLVLLFLSEHFQWGKRPVNTPLVEIDADSVDSLRIAYDDTSILMVRRASHWTIETPVRDMAAWPVISDLIAVTDQITVHRSFEPDSSLAPYGLRPAQTSLSWRDTQGWRDVYIGHTNPTGEYRYLKRGDETLVYLVPLSATGMLNVRLDDIRSKELLSMNMPGLKRIHWSAGGTGMTVARSDGGWTITDPIQCRADEKRIEEFLMACTGPQVADFISQEAGLPRFWEEWMRFVFVQDAGVKPETLWIRSETMPVLAVKSGRLHTLVLRGDADIEVPFVINDWRDRRLLPFPFHHVDSLIISRNGESGLAFQRTPSGWFAGGIRVASNRITGFIRTLEECSIDSFLPPSEAPDPRYVLRVRLWTAGDDSVDIALGPPVGSFSVISVSDLAAAALIPCIHADSVSTRIEDWRERRLVTIFEHDVVSIEFETDSEIATAGRLPSGEWHVSEAWPHDVEPSACIASLNTVRIQELMRRHPDTGPIRSEGTLKITSTGTPQHSIHLILRTLGVLHAAVDDGPMVVLDTTDENALIRLMNAFGTGE